MADEWEQYAVKSNDEWSQYEVAPEVAGKSPRAGFMDTAIDTYARAGMGAYDALKFLPGVKQLANITPGTSADELSTNIPVGNVGQQIVGGTGALAGTIPLASPFIKGASMIPVVGKNAIAAGAAGFGAFEGTKKGIEGKPGEILPAAAHGALAGAAFGAGGHAGASIASRLGPVAEKIGSSLGMGAAGAIMAPEGEKVSNFMIGAGIGAMNPVKGARPKTQAEITAKNAATYRQILAPGKGEINRVEIRSGKNLDDYYKLAAEEGIIIKSTADGKLDTSHAREQLQQKSTELNKQVEDMLASDKSNRFNLQDIGKQAKKNLRAKIKNDSDYLAASKIVDAEISAAIKQRGLRVDGKTLNTIKQGMWSKAYDPLNPTSNKTAREIGFSAKDAIEAAYPSNNIKGINGKLGEYLTLDALLDSAHGRVVAKGKLGRYIAQGTGAAIGAVAGSPIPYVGPVAGGILGRAAGGKVSDFMNNPERITTRLSKQAGGVSMPPRANPNFQPGKQTAPAAPLGGQTQFLTGQNSPGGQFNPIKPKGKGVKGNVAKAIIGGVLAGGMAMGGQAQASGGDSASDNNKMLDFIYQKESSGGTNPKAMIENSVGALGNYQITRDMFKSLQKEFPKKYSGKNFEKIVKNDVTARAAAKDSFLVLAKELSGHGMAPTRDAIIQAYFSGAKNTAANNIGPIGRQYIKDWSRTIKTQSPEETAR